MNGKTIEDLLTEARNRVQKLEREAHELACRRAAAEERIATILDVRSELTYASSQSTKCAGCGEQKHTPLRIDHMGGYVCLTCIDKELMKAVRV